MSAANDNTPIFVPFIDQAVPGQAMTIRQPHRKFGRCCAAFVDHAGDGKHVLARKLISSMFRSRWTKPLRVPRADVIAVHASLARPA